MKLTFEMVRELSNANVSELNSWSRILLREASHHEAENYQELAALEAIVSRELVDREDEI